MTDYERGQRDLINHIKEECVKALDSEGVDVMLDIISLLKGLEPKKESK